MKRSLILIGVLALAVSACSVEFSIGGKKPGAAAEELIEGEIAAQGGWTLTASCPELSDPGPGDVFECTATTDDGQVIRFRVEVGDDEIDVDSQNVLNADVVTRLEADIAEALSDQVGLPLPPENFECASGALILPPGNVVTCALTDPTTSEVWDAEVTIYGGDPIRFDVKVASEPRGS